MTTLGILGAFWLLASTGEQANPLNHETRRAICLDSPDRLVKDVAQEHGATLQWRGLQHNGDMIELYTSDTGWVLVRSMPNGVAGRACLIDVGSFMAPAASRYECDSDHSVHRLASMGSELRPMFWGRSVHGKRSYVLYTRSDERNTWAIRGSRPELTGTGARPSDEPCATIDGTSSQILRDF